jgi:crotonobetainyl-CoA:carnitine CoA-transferase CaiB-like acyl-CoA transferase
VRQKLKIDIDQSRVVNPIIMNVRGSAFGDKGSKREKSGFDPTVLWARGDSAMLVTPKELRESLIQPGAAYGDTISAYPCRRCRGGAVPPPTHW